MKKITKNRPWQAVAFFCAFAGAQFGGCGHDRSSGRQPVKPRDANVVLITLDTTRADHLGCYGPVHAGRRPGAKTPNLDALAARGVMFRNATVHSPLTLPSHSSILTGNYPPAHGLRDMEGFALSPSHATLATVARDNGFTTAAFVGSRVLSREYGLSNGFATYDDEIERVAERRAQVVTDRALAWLEQHHEKNFILWVHYFDPHLPYDPPKPYKNAYPRDPYAGEIAYMDEHAGRLLSAIRTKGLESRTLVVVIGDHGESLGEHGESSHGVFLYDSTLRVPFLLAGPGLPAGKVVDSQVRAVDVMPTALAFLGVPGPSVRGTNLFAPLSSGGEIVPADSYSETLYPRTYFGWSELRALRTGAAKFVSAPEPEFYNLKEDPGEGRNAIQASAAETEPLRLRLWQAAGEKPGEKLTANPVAGKARRDLESLGYIGGGTSGHIQLGTPAPDPKDRVEMLRILEQAEEQMEKKNWAGVARLAERGIRLDPTNPRCILYLASGYEHQGQYARAVEVLQSAVRSKVETDRILARLGIDYLQLRQPDKGIDAMQRARLMNPKDLHNLRNLGMAYLEQGRVDDAERTFRAILAQDDTYGAAHNGLGLIAVQRKDAEAARLAFEKAVAVDPREVKSLLDLGILHQQMGRYPESIRYLESFLGRVQPGEFQDQLPAIRAAIREMRGGR